MCAKLWLSKWQRSAKTLSSYFQKIVNISNTKKVQKLYTIFKGKSPDIQNICRTLVKHKKMRKEIIIFDFHLKIGSYN